MMHQTAEKSSQRVYRALRAFLPTPGNILFMILLISLTLLGQDILGQSTNLAEAEAATASVGTLIPYQGYLTDEEGTPLDGLYDMTFHIYSQPSGGTALWTEQRTDGNRVPITDGLFNVKLGELNAISRDVIVNSNSLSLGVTVDDGDELTPRVELNLSTGIQSSMPKVYSKSVFDNDITQVDDPIIYTTWFHGSDEGYQSHDLSSIFTEIDAVFITKTRLRTGNSNPVTFMVTDESGKNRPIPSEVKIWAYYSDSDKLASWIQGYVVVIGR